jgi:ATP phosphoribosyltransferase regulatory subunit HisZ
MKQPQSFTHKVQKELPEFVSEVSGLSVQDLDARLVTLTKGLAETEQAKEQDEELENAKALVSELSAPYRDAKKVLSMKIKYIVSLFEKES